MGGGGESAELHLKFGYFPFTACHKYNKQLKKTLHDLNYMPEQTTQEKYPTQIQQPITINKSKKSIEFPIDRHFMSAYCNKEQEHLIYPLSL